MTTIGCLMCHGPSRETVGMRCPECGTDYGRSAGDLRAEDVGSRVRVPSLDAVGDVARIEHHRSRGALMTDITWTHHEGVVVAATTPIEIQAPA